jgi:hypothetical protein
VLGLLSSGRWTCVHASHGPTSSQAMSEVRGIVDRKVACSPKGQYPWLELACNRAARMLLGGDRHYQTSLCCNKPNARDCGIGMVWSCQAVCLPCPAVASPAVGKVLVRFYGEHSSSWVAAKQLLPWDEVELQHKSAAVTLWGKKNNKCVILATAAALLTISCTAQSFGSPMCVTLMSHSRAVLCHGGCGLSAQICMQSFKMCCGQPVLVLVPTSLLPLHHKTCQLHVTRQWYPVTWCCVPSAWCCNAALLRLKLVTATLDELSARSDDPDEEVGATHMMHPLDSDCLAALLLSSTSM